MNFKKIGQVPIMYKNYEKRVKDFITDMANPSSQIIINDVTEKVENCRQELMNQSKMQKPFIFKGYTSEQDRINDTVKNNKLLFNLPDYPETKKNKSSDKDKSLKARGPIINFHIFEDIKIKEKEKEKEENEKRRNNTIESTTVNHKDNNDNKEPGKQTFKRRMSISEKNKINEIVRRDSILQPTMKFTARTDLERVYDMLNGDLMKNHERNIIERQLKHINLYNYKKPKELLKIANNSMDKGKDDLKDKNLEKWEEEEKKKHASAKLIYGPSNVYYEARNNDKMAWARKDNLNMEARRLLSSYHFKTHFKATEEIAELKSNKKNFIKSSFFILPHLLPKNHRYQNYNTSADVYNMSLSNSYKKLNNKKTLDYSKIKDTTNIFNFEKEHMQDEINDQLNEGNYNGINNPILKGNKNSVDPASLQILSKLAFNPISNPNEDLSMNENVSINLAFNDKEKDYDKNKNDDGDTNKKYANLNSVARKILNDCNVYTKKSKFNNSSHKKKGGKTMITKGMTVKEFENKYNFNK